MKMPVLFVGHGSPMAAIEKNNWTKALNKLGEKLPKPKAIACVSAHWVTKGTKVSTVEKPKTIHDFSGFPDELYEIEYPASGSPEIANVANQLLKGHRSVEDLSWGLDHGAWSILLHMYPNADVPVFQISLDISLNEKGHVLAGRELKSLREQGVMILGSGNIVHNLRMLSWGDKSGSALPWAKEFDENIATALETRDEDFLTGHKLRIPEPSRLSVPTDEHYSPLLACFGASDENDKISYPYLGYDMGALSMRTVLWS